MPDVQVLNASVRGKLTWGLRIGGVIAVNIHVALLSLYSILIFSHFISTKFLKGTYSLEEEKRTGVLICEARRWEAWTSPVPFDSDTLLFEVGLCN